MPFGEYSEPVRCGQLGVHADCKPHQDRDASLLRGPLLATHFSRIQDADLILFISRDEVYNQDTPDKGVAEIIIGRQWNGPIGTIRLAFLGQCTRFENVATPGNY